MSRRKSLYPDKADWAAFRHHRDRHMGFCVSNEFYQRVPFFFTREGMSIELIGQYRGGSLFIVCNGPSLLNLDLTQLDKPGVITYGMNNGPKTYRPNFWTCVDDPKRFLKSIWFDPKICKIVPHAHLEKNVFDSNEWKDLPIKVGDCPNVMGYHRNEKFHKERFLFEDKFNWGNHKNYGGCRSVMLPVLRAAFLLGFRTIYFIGCDLKMSETYTYHFDEQREAGAVMGNRNTYDRLITEYLPGINEVWQTEGGQIFNCNPDSALVDIFPFKDFKDAIHDTTACMGDLANERTWGLYGDMKRRHEYVVEPSPEQKAKIQVEQGKKRKEKELKKSQKDENKVQPSQNQNVPYIHEMQHVSTGEKNVYVQPEQPQIQSPTQKIDVVKTQAHNYEAEIRRLQEQLQQAEQEKSQIKQVYPSDVASIEQLEKIARNPKKQIKDININEASGHG